jgi:CheY-like chemotaxis protein/HPt (histidine-containing phosphotransfer) domain-containing protein
LVKPVKSRALRDCLEDLLAGRTGGAVEPPPEAAPAPVAACRRILLVEDNLINQKVALAILERAGHVVDVAANGLQAVEAAAAAAYDLILMDIQMPVMDGIEATRLIREGPRGGTPIIAMTANAMRGAREEYLALGMDGYLAKPIDARALAEIVEVLGRRAGEAEASAREEAEPPVLDAGHLDTIREILPSAEFIDLVGAFLVGAEARLDRLARLVAAGGLADAARELHDIVSTAGNFGARRMETLARRMEAACRAGDAAAAEAEMPALAEAAAQAFVLLRHRLLAMPA